MTGPEIVAGLAAGAKGAKKVVDALGGDAKEQEQLSRLAEDTKALEVAANARADRVAIRQLVLTKLYAPLAKWVGYKSDYFDDHFADEMAEKLADVPEEHIVSPSPIVAAQSIEGLSYSLDEPALKDMYLNLLATASDDRRSDYAHPAFAQILKQLTPVEAAYVVKAIEWGGGRGLPIAVLKDSEGEGIGFLELYRHLVQLLDNERKPVEDEDYPMYVDNWIRLGLVDADYLTFRSGEEAYAWVESRPEYERFSKLMPSDGSRKLTYDRGILRPTALGVRFARAVSSSGADAGTRGGR
ncbi:DUF4393 domain-containing protein [Cellulosimicrobium cellulans]|uniref:DUF4393 domain-containing protein n=1 Tax=Cellulosimicrobium cellulans TaxID=1710 RepID=UPI0035DE4201